MLELSRMSDDGNVSVVRSRKLQEPVDPLTHNSLDYDEVVFSWLQEFDFDLLHIRHLGWHGLSLPRLARQLGKKVILSFHDYYAISPTIKLIDDQGVFLGNNFIENGSIYRESIWPKHALPTPRGNWLAFWRERFEESFLYCDGFVTTSPSARQLIIEHFPKLPLNRFFVIPHGRDFSEWKNVGCRPKKGEAIRILVPGNINHAKGLGVIQSLLRLDSKRKLEFHILGKVVGLTDSRLVLHGVYKRDEFADRASKIQPHIGAIFSIWDETYCHTLTELWSIGLPALVFDFPNVADRVRRSGAGWVVCHNNVDEIYKEILRIANDIEGYNRVCQAAVAWQNGYGLANNVAQMSASYLNLYGDILFEKKIGGLAVSPNRRKRIAVLSPSSVDLKQAPASTHIRIWERTRNSVSRDLTYIRTTAAGLIASVNQKMVDGAVIQRNAVPLDLVDDLLRVLSSNNIPYLFDLDDDLLNVPQDKDLKRVYANGRSALEKIIVNANMLSVSTESLYKKMSLYNSNVMLLPNYLSDRLWRGSVPLRVNDGLVRVLYMGSQTHDEDLLMILPALDLISSEYPNFRLSLIGVVSDDKITKGRNWIDVINPPVKNYVEFVAWMRSLVLKINFAIAPLKDTPFNVYKSDLKLLEYGGLGLPVIASDVEVYRNSMIPEGVSLVANDFHSWVSILRERILRVSEAECEGERLRQWVLGNRMMAGTLAAFDNEIMRVLND